MTRNSAISRRLSAPAALAILATILLTGCNFNIFSPVDSPSGDKQLLSAARAALDRGDFAKALEYYQKLSADNAEVAASETAYTTLAQYNAGMTAFATAFGSGGGGGAGKGITKIANDIGSAAGATARRDIFHAFQQTGRIPDNAPLRGLVRFLTSIALIAEMLAEGATDPTHFVADDLASNPTACEAGGTDLVTGCAVGSNAACTPSSSPVLIVGPTTPGDLNSIGDTEIDAGPSLSLIHSAILQIGKALGPDEINAKGNLSSAVSTFTSDPKVSEGALGSPGGGCYRYILVHYGFGTY